MILEMVSPVTHSVANSVKRVVIIVSSVIFFQTPVSPVNALGKSPMAITFKTHACGPKWVPLGRFVTRNAP